MTDPPHLLTVMLDASSSVTNISPPLTGLLISLSFPPSTPHSPLFWPHLWPVGTHPAPHRPYLRALAHAVLPLRVAFAPVILLPVPNVGSHLDPRSELLMTPLMSPFLRGVISQVVLLSTVTPYSYFPHALMVIGHCMAPTLLVCVLKRTLVLLRYN